jgi:hypothetical protein
MFNVEILGEQMFCQRFGDGGAQRFLAADERG